MYSEEHTAAPGLILYMPQILSQYLDDYLHKGELREIYPTIDDMLDQMRPIGYTLYRDHHYEISTFDEEQLKICRLIGFESPIH